MLEWGVVKPDDIVARDPTDEAVLKENGNVMVAGEEMSLQKRLKQVFGWPSVQTYSSLSIKRAADSSMASEMSILKSRPLKSFK